MKLIAAKSRRGSKPNRSGAKISGCTLRRPVVVGRQAQFQSSEISPLARSANLITLISGCHGHAFTAAEMAGPTAIFLEVGEDPKTMG